MLNFLKDENIEQLIVQSVNVNSVVYSTNSETAEWIKGRKAMVCLKLVDKVGIDEDLMQNEITADIMQDVLVFMEVTKNALQHMHGIFEQIFMPLLHNEQNSRQWTELVSKDLIEKFNNYLAQTFVTMGQIDGQTQLPTPPHKLTSGDNISEKDKAHVFEGCVIMWTKQIKNILKLEPE